jgi:hypothetical protein
MGNPTNTDHFYTTYFSELGEGRNGYIPEGVVGYVYDRNQLKPNGTTELYRYWNATIGDHFYTTDFSELGGGRSGYVFERVEGYVLR